MTDKAENNERRALANPKARERRYIKRLSEPLLRKNIQQIVLFSRLVLGFATIYVIAIATSAVSQAGLGRTKAFFIVTATFLFGISLWMFERAAVSYLSNESVERLVISLEKMRNFFLVILVLVFVFGGVHLISLF